MNDIDQLEAWLREFDPAFGIDRSPYGPAGRRLYQEVRQRADVTPGPRRGLGRSAPGRPPKPSAVWRRSLVLGAVIVLAAVVVVVVPNVLPGGTPAYAIRRLSSGLIVIDWSMDSFAPNANKMAADLRGYGVDVQITTVPSSPSEVGKVMATFAGEGDGMPLGLSVGKAGTPGAFTWTFDPTVFHGPVTLEVQVPASEGEHYLVSNSVFAPGEVLGGLQCALGEPLLPAAVAARLSSLGLTAVWNVSRLLSSDPTGSSWQDTQVSEVPNGYIAEGHSLDDATVEFTVVSDRATLSQYQDGSPLSDVPCTPKQAAAWRS